VQVFELGHGDGHPANRGQRLLSKLAHPPTLSVVTVSGASSAAGRAPFVATAHDVAEGSFSVLFRQPAGRYAR
jgi:hypothetical protein